MIHYENASYTQIAEILKQFGITEVSSANAVYTYIAEEPCNYLKYYLGYLEILALRELFRDSFQDSSRNSFTEATEPASSDYAFHEFYLNAGPSDFTSLGELLESYTSTEITAVYSSSIMDSK